MNWLDKLERKFGRFYIRNLMLYITSTMLFVTIFDRILRIPLSQYLALVPADVFQGQVWRLITFIFIPPASSLITILFALYFYYFIGSSLESAWGSFQFNVYYLVGMLGTIIAALISGSGTSTYLNLSLFLAFAQIYPEHEVLLFFFLPIKIKYLAYIDWALFIVSLLFGNWYTRAAVVASLINFFIFFGGDFIRDIRRKLDPNRRNFRKYYR